MGKKKEYKIVKNYKLIDLLKFICAFLVVGIHVRSFQAVSELLDKLFYYTLICELEAMQLSHCFGSMCYWRCF